MNNKMYIEAYEMALKVEFLASGEELKLYAGALYSAMKWGRVLMKEIKKSKKRIFQ